MEKNNKMNYMEPVLEIMVLNKGDVITGSNDPLETEDDIF